MRQKLYNLICTVLYNIMTTFDKPVYVSLTSIERNQVELLETLKSIVVSQSLKPTQVFLYLSDEPSFFDNGFTGKKIANVELNNFINVHNETIHIEWGKDIGPYGKLLPILKQKWDEDCLIITVDDDTIYHKDLVKNLVQDYCKHHCVIGYRGFVPNAKNIFEITYDDRLQNIGTFEPNREKSRHLLNFPTGKGGVLYHPAFFHRTEELIFENRIYLDTCATADDVWFCLLRIMNQVPCHLEAKPWLEKDISTSGLFVNFNHNNNKNNMHIKKTVQRLRDLYPGYMNNSDHIIDFMYRNTPVTIHTSQNDHLSKTWDRGIFYEDRLLEKIQSLNLPDTYIDIGAHHGNHTIYFSKFCKSSEILSIEGNPYNFGFLKTNVTMNNCTNIKMYKTIVSDLETIRDKVTLDMEYNIQNTGCSYVVSENIIENVPVQHLQKCMSETTTVDQLLCTYKNPISLIKIDVQKHEYQTLLGCTELIETHKPILVISLHSNPFERDIEELLKKWEYRTDKVNYGVSPTFIYERII